MMPWQKDNIQNTSTLYRITFPFPVVVSHHGQWIDSLWIASFCPIVIFLRFINTLRPRQNGRRFADEIFKWIFLNENVWILINISLKFVPQGSINNIPALVQIMAWRRPGDKPLSRPIMFRLPTHIFVTRPQWVNGFCMMFAYVCYIQYAWNRLRCRVILVIVDEVTTIKSLT